jgi:hypothetical protein
MSKVGRVLVVGLAAALVASSLQIAGHETFATRITFRGLLAIVTPASWDRAHVLLVDESRTSMRNLLPKHDAILTIPVAAVVDPQPDGYLDDERAIGVWRLDNHEVHFRSHSLNSQSVMLPVRTANQVRTPLTTEQWRDVRWIADANRFLDQARVE